MLNVIELVEIDAKLDFYSDFFFFKDEEGD